MDQINGRTIEELLTSLTLEEKSLWWRAMISCIPWVCLDSEFHGLR